MSSSTPLTDRLKKLRAAQPRELLSRVRYAAVVAKERRLLAWGHLSPPRRLRTALRSDLGAPREWESRTLEERRAAKPISAALEDVPALRRLFAGRYHTEREATLEASADALRHRFQFFGETFHLPPRIPWHTDPQTGKVWPTTYHGDVAIHRADIYGDVKYVWELNRHQFLVDLAKTALLEGATREADEVVAIVRDWTDSVPYATGVPWACALEPAFRVWSWLWAYEMLRQSETLPDDAHLDWLTAFYDHGRFLFQHLEVYASP